jgi:hypothetical protein
MNYLPTLALNLDPLDLCLLSSWDYRREPPVPSHLFLFIMVISMRDDFVLQSTFGKAWRHFRLSRFAGFSWHLA